MSKRISAILTAGSVLWLFLGEASQAGDGAKPTIFEVKEKKFHELYLCFAEGKRVEIRVTSTTTHNNTDVDLFVFDEKNKLVAKDETIGKDCAVEFTPAQTQFFRVVVVNLGPGDSNCTLKYTGTDVKLKVTELKPVELKENEKVRYQIGFEGGKPAGIWVNSEKDSDVDLFVFDSDGKRVASDERVGKDCFVSFRPNRTASYRVEVLNLGPGDNRSRIRHTGEIKK